MIFLLLQKDPISSEAEIILYILFFGGIAAIVISRFFMFFFEQIYAKSFRKPFFRTFPFYRRKLSKSSKQILERQFNLYKKLSITDKRLFEHRVATFISEKQFVGREGVEVTEEMKVLISATAIMLTFGFRSYLIKILSTIIIYPDAFYSKTNKDLHKGEFNPHLGVMALSWKDFVKGYDIENDNLNLGIHEMAHAIHLDVIKNRGINSIIFHNSYQELAEYLDNNIEVKEKLISTEYFRAYAYTNQFEFVAVIIENFVETPDVFLQNFPLVYNKIKQMLNFKF